MNSFDPTQSQRDPSKPYFQKRPTSLRSSGSELDVECGSVDLSIATGEAAFEAMDKATDATFFAPETTGHAENKNGVTGLPMISKRGQQLINKTAPSDAFKLRGEK